MVLREKVYTADDLWELSHQPEYANLRLELSDGRLIIMSPAGTQHGGLTSWLDRNVGNFVDEHELGITTAAETGFILYKNPDPKGKDTVRAPDVGFIRAERAPGNWKGLPKKYFPFAPDLGIEVVSPNDKEDEVSEKVADYLKYGVRLIWVFYIEPEEIKVHAPNRETRTLKVGDTLEGEDVLPGFRLPVIQVFPPDKPNDEK
jgi:Uma2 family endonuclease